MKKNIGIVLTVLGSGLLLSGINLGFTKYNLSSPHDLSKFLGAAGVSLLILIAGVAMLVNKPNVAKNEQSRRSRTNSRRG